MAPSRDNADLILIREHAVVARDNLLFGIPSGLIVAALMAAFVPLQWAALAAFLLVACALGSLLALRRGARPGQIDLAGAARAKKVLVAINTTGGFIWGAFLLLLLPSSAEGQLLLAAVIPAIMLFNLIEAAAVRASFLGFHVPFGAVTAVGYALLADGTARWIAVLIVVLAAHALPVANSVRRNARTRAELQVGRASLIDDLRTANEELEFRSRHDGLTGLINRTELEARMQEVGTDHPEPLEDTVLFIDLDGFKRINDRYGHHVGDRVIVAVASRIQAALPEGALACRMGGDEFVVVLQGAPGTANEGAIEALIAAVGQPIPNLSNERVTASVGLVRFRPGRDSPSEVVGWADAAMYRAKAAGGSCWRSIDIPASASADELRRADRAPVLAGPDGSPE